MIKKFLLKAYDWWLDDMYLNNMTALPVISNPAWVFPRQDFKSTEDMFVYLANIIDGIANFKQDLEK